MEIPAIKLAPIPNTICNPLLIPSAKAENTEVLSPFRSSVTSVTRLSSVSGVNILATKIEPNGTIAEVTNNHSIGIPNKLYPTKIDADIDPIPATNTVINSERVMSGKYLATKKGDSV